MPRDEHHASATPHILKHAVLRVGLQKHAQLVPEAQTQGHHAQAAPETQEHAISLVGLQEHAKMAPETPKQEHR
jgi:hypothetical protein